MEGARVKAVVEMSRQKPSTAELAWGRGGQADLGRGKGTERLMSGEKGQRQGRWKEREAGEGEGARVQEHVEKRLMGGGQ